MMSDTDFKFTLVPMTKHGFFWATFSGEVSVRGLGVAHDEFTNHPEYVPGMDEFLDFTKASVKQLSVGEIEQMRSYLITRPDRHGAKSVVIVDSQLEFGLGRMMGSLMEPEVPMDRWICYSVREGLDWLRPGKADQLIEEHKAMTR